MDPNPTVLETASTCSTEIINEKEFNCEKSTTIQNNLSVITTSTKIEFGSKITVPLSGNILCVSSATQPWLDLVAKLAGK